MAVLTFLLCLLNLLAADADHKTLNPLYRELVEKGVAVSKTQRSRLPEPTMADGLDAKAQARVIETLAGENYSIKELMRQSEYAPHIYKFRSISPSDPEAAAYGVDLWFIAYGDWKTLKDKDLKGFFASTRKDVKSQALTPKELAARRITLETKDPPQEQYAHVVFPVLDRVQVSMTTYTYTSRTPSSIVVATKLDSRFQGDRDFPNAWRHLERKEEGKRALGPTHPFDGTGMYLKVTPLAEPAGALFVEYHRVSLEPKKWFDNPNQLRSKLPFLIRDEVRAFRHSLKKKSIDP